jgi:hypothetical protein
MKEEHKLLIVGGVAGALIGVLAAYLYAKSHAEEMEMVKSGEGGVLAQIAPGQYVALGLGLLGVLRQISDLGR